jgi:hypothetical protein
MPIPLGVICFIGAITLLLGGVLFASWKSFMNYYENFTIQHDENKFAAWSLLHPGWWLLPFVPVMGRGWIDNLLDKALLASSLRLPFEKADRAGQDVKDFKGGDCILISEYYERGSGISYAVRIMPLLRNSVFRSGFNSVNELAENEIPVYTARPLTREWAAIEQIGDTFELRVMNRDFVISIIKAAPKKPFVFSSNLGHRLDSGDRFIFDITEFQFLKLPSLALVDQAGEIICKDIEAGYSAKTDGFYPQFTISGGKLGFDGSDHEFYSPVIGFEQSSDTSPKEILLQPGDTFFLSNGSVLKVSYLGIGKVKR